MNKYLYSESQFRDRKAYGQYLEKIRRGKNYVFFRKLADMIIKCRYTNNDAPCLREIVEFVHREMNSRNAYHHAWYSDNASRAVELVLQEI